MLRESQSKCLIYALTLACLFATIVAAHSEQVPTSTTMAENFAEFLKAEEQATKHAGDVVERSLTAFTWIVGVVGGLLVAGAALLGWAIQHWSRANKTDIQKEVEKQLKSEVVKAIESEIAATKRRIEQIGQDASEFSKQLEEARNQVLPALDTQQKTINQLIILTMGQYPYDYLKSIYNKKEGFDPKREFLWQQQPAFKREMGFLLDHGYLENIGLEQFTDQENIIDKLILTEAGKLYVKLRQAAGGSLAGM
jgi:hypothetical protein